MRFRLRTSNDPSPVWNLTPFTIPAAIPPDPALYGIPTNLEKYMPYQTQTFFCMCAHGEATVYSQFIRRHTTKQNRVTLMCDSMLALLKLESCVCIAADVKPWAIYIYVYKRAPASVNVREWMSMPSCARTFQTLSHTNYIVYYVICWLQYMYI